MLPRMLPSALETSPDEFAARFAAYAARGRLYPQPEGSPLLEFVCAGLPLYLFDRMGPYAARSGDARVVVHGILERCELLEGGEEELRLTGISRLCGVGRVLDVESRRSAVVQARLPLVLSRLEGLPPLSAGDWLAFETQSPLHGFLVREGPLS